MAKRAKKKSVVSRAVRTVKKAAKSAAKTTKPKKMLHCGATLRRYG